MVARKERRSESPRSRPPLEAGTPSVRTTGALRTKLKNLVFADVAEAYRHARAANSEVVNFFRLVYTRILLKASSAMMKTATASTTKAVTSSDTTGVKELNSPALNMSVV